MTTLRLPIDNFGHWIVNLMAVMLLAACANPLTVPQTPQGAIDEANVMLHATANVIAQNVADGIYTKAEGQKYLDKVRDLAKKVDDAQALVDAGLPDAKDRAELVRRLIVALHREVAQRARNQ